MNRIRWYGPSLVLLAAVLATLWLGPRAVRQIAWAQQDAQITLARNSLAENPTLAQLSDAYRKVALAVEPSVVHVEVLGGGDRSLLQRFFNMPDHPQLEPRDRQFEQFDPLPQSGNGSGWVYDEAGHIVTNYHVIANAQELRIHFFDGGKYDAEVVGYDELTDVAVLRVGRDNLHPASTADEPVQPGDIVFAFGSPLNFDFSVSQGIVSAKGRELGLLARRGGYENFIQTDAAINPGNSGGPLTNIYGEVVGMNSAIASRSGGFMGIGFAIPVDMVRNIADQIIASGAVSRGYMGIYMYSAGELTPELARTFGYEGDGGVLIDDVLKGGPAAEAGIQPGDIITHINDQPMDNQRQLRRFVASFPPGQTIKATVFRAGDDGGQTLNLDVTLDEFPRDIAAAPAQPQDPPQDQAQEPDAQQTQTLGMLRNFGIERVTTFTEQIAQRAGVEFRPGVLIEDVRGGSLAAPPNAPGLDPGTLITRVSGTDVTTVDELTAELAKHDAAEGIRVRVAVWDRGGNRWVERFWLIRLPD